MCDIKYLKAKDRSTRRALWLLVAVLGVCNLAFVGPCLMKPDETAWRHGRHGECLTPYDASCARPPEKVISEALYYADKFCPRAPE